jgi:hypothetical protein
VATRSTPYRALLVAVHSYVSFAYTARFLFAIISQGLLRALRLCLRVTEQTCEGVIPLQHPFRCDAYRWGPRLRCIPPRAPPPGTAKVLRTFSVSMTAPPLLSRISDDCALLNELYQNGFNELDSHNFFTKGRV